MNAVERAAEVIAESPGYGGEDWESNDIAKALADAGLLFTDADRAVRRVDFDNLRRAVEYDGRTDDVDLYGAARELVDNARPDDADRDAGRGVPDRSVSDLRTAFIDALAEHFCRADREHPVGAAARAYVAARDAAPDTVTP